MRMAALFDDASRLAVYRMAEKDSKIAEELGLRTSEEVTRHVNMDFQNMTDFENNVMRMVIPFYAYARQAIELHAKNILRNPGRYRVINQGIQNGQSELSQDLPVGSIPEWLKYSGDLPFVFGANNENVGMIKLGYSLPYTNLEDVVNFIGDGIRAAAHPTTLNETRVQQSTGNLAGMFSPIIKAAAESASQKDLFTGQTSSGIFLDELAKEIGGVFTKVPNIISKIASGTASKDDEQSIAGLMTNLLGLYHQMPTDSLNRQRVYELIKYLQSEIKKYTQAGNVLPSYAYAKQQLEGMHYSKLNLTQPRSIRIPKNKKKITLWKKSDEFL